MNAFKMRFGHFSSSNPAKTVDHAKKNSLVWLKQKCILNQTKLVFCISPVRLVDDGFWEMFSWQPNQLYTPLPWLSANLRVVSVCSEDLLVSRNGLSSFLNINLYASTTQLQINTQSTGSAAMHNADKQPGPQQLTSASLEKDKAHTHIFTPQRSIFPRWARGQLGQTWRQHIVNQCVSRRPSTSLLMQYLSTQHITQYIWSSDMLTWLKISL